MYKIGSIIFYVSIILAFSIIAGCIQDSSHETYTLSPTLTILNWEDYFYPTIVQDFKERYNVTLHIITFDEEDYMISELETNPGAYDFMIVSDASVRRLIAAKALSPLDKQNIPNLVNIDESFMNKSYDPTNLYSLPYLWGTTGIAYNASAVPNDPTSWSLLWNTSYQGTIAIIDNKEEVVGAALKYLGYGLNPTDQAQLSEAGNILKEQKNSIAGYFGSREIVEGLISGSFMVAQCYSGDALYAAERNPDILYVIPEEGASIWIDAMVIPVDSSHKYTAEIFMNYLLEPQISAAITNYQWYANPNFAANPYIDREILEDDSIYPSVDVLSSCEFFTVIDSEIIREMNRLWSELKSGP